MLDQLALVKSYLIAEFKLYAFLTNVFNDVEAVADSLGALSIAQQPEKT